MNRIWIWILFEVEAWIWRRLQRAHTREKLRQIKRELERRSVWKN